jgi:c(7)-type cytochrome triheme protein
MFARPEQSTLSSDTPPARPFKRRLSLLVLLFGVLAFVFACLPGSRVSALPESPSTDEAGNFSHAYAQAEGKDFSKFTHRNGAHTRLPCLLCHRREASLTQPKRPGHMPCAGCHAEQFANPGSSICTICHANPKTEKPDIKPFPKFASFGMKFDHARHKNAVCSTCHKPAGRNNAALSIPSGFAAHTVCYQCLTERAQSAGRDISSCGTCHESGNYRRTPITAKAFQVNFSHARHGKSQQLNCSECHQVKAGFPQSRQVSAPLPANHSAPEHALSCKSCHNGKRAFGGDDFKSCQRCHTGQTFRFQ